MVKKRIECFGEKYEEQQGHIGEEVTLSFEHNEQSALLFYDLVNNAKVDLDRIDLNRLIYAILSHSTTRVVECPKDLIAQIVRHVDKIEYRNKDFDELTSYLKLENMGNIEYASKTSEERIVQIQKDIVEEAIQKGKIDDNMEALKELRQLRKHYKQAIYFLQEGTKGLLTSENIERNKLIIKKLLEYYYENPEDILTKYYFPVKPINFQPEKKIHSVYDTLSRSSCTRVEKAINFILGMDNNRAEKQYLRLVKQRIITGKGIEPITEEEIQEVRQQQEEERIEKWKAKELQKSSQPHTNQEIRNMLRSKDRKFIKGLTKEGLSVIEKTTKKIEKDAQLDKLLYEQMEQADLARKYNREVVQSINIGGVIEEKPKLSEEERRKQVAIDAKKKWNNHEDSQGEER